MAQLGLDAVEGTLLVALFAKLGKDSGYTRGAVFCDEDIAAAAEQVSNGDADIAAPLTHRAIALFKLLSDTSRKERWILNGWRRWGEGSFVHPFIFDIAADCHLDRDSEFDAHEFERRAQAAISE